MRRGWESFALSRGKKRKKNQQGGQQQQQRQHHDLEHAHGPPNDTRHQVALHRGGAMILPRPIKSKAKTRVLGQMRGMHTEATAMA